MKKKSPVHFSWNPIHPRRDWKRLILAFIIFFILIVAWSSYLYLSSGRSDIAEAGAPEVVENVTTTRLNAISSYIDER